MQRFNVCIVLMLVLSLVNFWSADAATSAQSPFSGVNYRPDGNSLETNTKYAAATSDKNVLDRFTHRYPDGSYEFRYELLDGTARYERGYFIRINKVKSLVVVGYYSYRMPDGRYITVFYNADQHGYRQNQSITPQVYPNLPRSIEVPQLKEQQDYVPVTTQKSVPTPSSTTRRSRF